MPALKRLPHLALLFIVSLVAACTCISTNIENKTEEPIFVTQVDNYHGRTYEDFGYLVLPEDNVSIGVYGGGDIRARNMRGNTVFYAPLPEDEDSSFDVTSLRPVPEAKPLGSPSTGRFGFDSPWSLKTCRDGEELTVPLFGLLATVKNESTKALVVSVDEYPGHKIYDWKYGVFAAPGQTVHVFENVTEEPYVRAFDQEGQLVFMAPLPRTERPTAVIPEALALDPPVKPVAPYNNDCRGIAGILNGHLDGGDVVSLAVAATMFGALLVGALVTLFVTVRFFWDFYIRKPPS